MAKNGERGKRQGYGGLAERQADILLSAVTKLYASACNAYSEGTWEEIARWLEWMEKKG